MKTAKFLKVLTALSIFFTLNSCGQTKENKSQKNTDSKMKNIINKPENPYYSNFDTQKLNVSEAEWKKVLSPDLYAVAREADTERAFTGTMWNSEAKGTYYCAACGYKLFKSTQNILLDGTLHYDIY